MITKDTVVVGRSVADLTLEQFTAILEAASSPALIDAEKSYQAVINVGVSPALALAIFNQESAFGSVGLAVPNKNPGNTRSSTTGIGMIVTTVKGVFIRYPSWYEGFRDLAWRLVKPNYSYALEGRRTIKEIIYRWAPPEDGNDTERYISDVVTWMNQWIGAISMKDPTTKTDLLKSKAGRGRKDERTGIVYQAGFITIHIQEGENYLPAYFASMDADSTVWVTEDGQIIRMLYDTDEAWTNGRWSEPINHANPVIETCYKMLAPKGLNSNIVALTAENQGFAGKQLTDRQYQGLAQMCAYWCSVNGWPADRQHIVGHYEVGEHKGCPGKAVSLERLVAMTQSIMAGAATPQPVDNTDAYADPNVWHCLVTDKWVVNEYGFLKRWRDMGGLAVIGYPITGARVQKGTIPDPTDPNTGIVEQYFERARFEYHRKDSSFHLGLVGSEALTANVEGGKTDPA